MVKFTSELAPIIPLGTWWDHISILQPQLPKNTGAGCWPPLPESLLSLLEGGAWAFVFLKALLGSLKCRGLRITGPHSPYPGECLQALGEEKHLAASCLAPSSICTLSSLVPDDIRAFGRWSGFQPL